MWKTARNFSLNSGRVLHLYERIDDPANRHFNVDEWELPGEAYAQDVDGEATIYLGSQTAGQAVRISARSVWRKEAPDHRNPAAREDGESRPYQFLAKISLPSKKLEGYQASIMASLIARSSRARRRGSEKPRLLARAGDPCELVTIRGQSYAQRHVRNRRPADEATRMPTRPYSL